MSNETKTESFFKRNSALFSFKTGEYITPKWLWQELNNLYHFQIDAATTQDNPLQTPIFYTSKEDGLKQIWEHTTYVNPPYGRDIDKWVRKAANENQRFGVNVVMLLPARTDTAWFHDYILHNPDAQVEFIRGRLKFEGTGNTAPFPSMIVIFMSCAEKKRRNIGCNKGTGIHHEGK